MNDYKVDLKKPITTGKLLNPHINLKLEKKDANKFEVILKQTIENKDSIIFSKHAKERIEARKINFEKSDIAKIYRAFELAEEKGVEDSLVLLNDIALIVNVPSKTVITAIDGQNIKQNVFTNIDGAVIV